MTPPLDQISSEIRDALGQAPHPEAAVAHRRLLEGLKQQRARRRWWISPRVGLGALGVAAAAAAAVLLIAWPQSQEVPAVDTLRAYRADGAAVGVGEWLAVPPETRPVEVAFSEGSELTLRPGGRARLLRATRDAVEVAVARGIVRASIVSGKKLTWTFHAGPYRVRVVGTQLALRWSAEREQLALRVDHGAVKVWGGPIGREGVVVAEGQRLDSALGAVEVRVRPVGPDDALELPEPDPEIADAGTADAVVETDAESADQTLPTQHRRPSGRRPLTAADHRWRGLAREGRYADAVAAAERVGWPRLLAQLEAEDLLALADAARLARSVGRAEAALGAIRRRFAGQRVAGTAAFRLGRLAYEQQRDDRAAARWFRQALREQPRGEIAADARGRLMLALGRGGDEREAKRVAREYLARHPGGAYAEAARAILASRPLPP